VINVVKPYTPTISDAFKLKSTPTLDDDATTQKKEIDYSILSVPVASTYIPTKGKAAVVEQEKPTPVYDNYINFGYGSYGNLQTELNASKEFNRIGSFGARFALDKSKDGIEDEVLDDSFSKLKVELDYINRQRDLTWSVRGGLKAQEYNWYGVDDRYNISKNKNKDVEHNYYDLYLEGDVEYDYTYIRSASLTLRRFYDNFDSGETHLDFDGTVNLPVMDEEINTDVRFEYFSGQAGTTYANSRLPEYGNLLLGVSPSYEIRRDDYTLNVSVSMYYMLGMDSTESNFYLFPNLTGSYRIVDDALIAYGGFTGDVIQNTYRDFVHTNPFLSPSINVKPTDNNFNVYAGMLGKFTNNISYNVKVGYSSEDDKFLFMKNPFPATGDSMAGSTNYKYGNSFQVVYDDINTLQALLEVNADMNKNLKIGFRAEYNNYHTTLEEEAWNLPSIKGSLFGDYVSDYKWFAGANFFYVGERKDQNLLQTGTTTTSEIIDVKGYFDLNLNGGYNVSNAFTVFVKLNNLTAQNYEHWDNYNLQGFQVLGGATFQFDF
ncbi:TonB-dependent receptor, partial [Formosa agariphila KMM 3901]